MAKIHLLEKQVAELIAAGEVVERPASIVKELVENAVDAGATAITVEIQGGGIRMIRITDNGCGIERADVANAFVRHATSKLRASEDLEHIMTMGFRGEALASVAAMCKVELLTRTKEETAGTRYVICGGQQQAFEDAGCPVGTTIMVRDVFYNTPARMKFLKKDVSEGNSVAAAVEKAALAYPEISFSFVRDGVQKLQTPGDGKLLSAVRCALGKELAESMIAVDYKLENGLRLEGLISKPQAARGSRALQNFFINRRFIRSKTCMAALEEAYRGSLMVGRFPSCVLHLTIPAETVDVNVHPAKIEVRFADEKSIFSLVHYGCKTALGAADSSVAMQLKQATRPVQAEKTPVFEQQRISAADYRQMIGQPDQTVSAAATRLESSAFAGVASSQATRELPTRGRVGERVEAATQMPNGSSAHSYGETSLDAAGLRKAKPIIDIETDREPSASSLWFEPCLEQAVLELKSSMALQGEYTHSGARPLWKPVDFTASGEEKMLDAAMPQQIPLAGQQNPNDDALTNNCLGSAQTTAPDLFADARLVGELFDTYLILQHGSHMLLVDKHAAHERLLFNRLVQGGLEEERQILLAPVSVRLGAEEYSAAVGNLDAFSAAGLTVEDFGDGFVLVREVVPLLAGADLAVIVEELADRLARENHRMLPQKVIDLYHTTACRAAIKANDKTERLSLERLLELLRGDADVGHCPHGRPIVVRVEKQEIEKKFGRLG